MGILTSLENCEMQIYNALYNGNRQEKENALEYAVTHMQGMKEELHGYWLELQKMGGVRFLKMCRINELTDEGLFCNLNFCIDIINHRINTYNFCSISTYAVQTIFYNQTTFVQNDIIYYNQDKKLTVSDFLSALDYAKKFSEACLGADYSKYSEALQAIKTVDLALHHKKEDKPLNKTLHLVNNLLTECARKAHKEESEKRIVSGISLIIDLAIDFLVGK